MIEFMGVTPMSYSGKLVIPLATPEIFSLTQISTSDPKKPPIFESFQTMCRRSPMKMKAANKKAPKKSKKLSDREILVLILICKEFLASQAAKRLGISVKTFNNHRFN